MIRVSPYPKEGDTRAVLEEARKFTKKFQRDDLEPKPPQKGLAI
jgi:hypothetical protein